LTRRYSTVPALGIGSNPHVRFHHLRITGNLFVTAFRDHRTTLHYRDGVAEVRHHAHVVFHHEDGTLGGNFADQLFHFLHIFVPHALRGFIEQQKFRIERQGGGDFERPLAAVWQLHSHDIRLSTESHAVQ